MSEATTTTDHATIRRWVEARDGRPARVKATAGGEPGSGSGGILRIDFREPDEALEELSWEAFFEIFDRNRLAFLHQDKTADGSTSRFFKFVER
jgi:hypothetical protein